MNKDSAQTPIFDDTGREISSTRLATTATPQNIVHGQENLSLNTPQAQSGSSRSAVHLLVQNQADRMSAIPQVAQESDTTNGILAGGLISGSDLGHLGHSRIQVPQTSSMAGHVNATFAEGANADSDTGYPPLHQHDPQVMQIYQRSPVTDSTNATFAAGAGTGCPFSPRQDPQAMQVYQTPSMAGSTNATIAAGAGAGCPFSRQQDHQAMQVYQTSSRAGSTSATFEIGAGACYPFSPRQGPQEMQVSASQALSMTCPMNTTFAAGPNADPSAGYPFSPQQDPQAVQVYQMPSMADPTSATLAAGADASYPFLPQRDPQAMQVCQRPSMTGSTSATLVGGAGACYPFSSQQDPQVHVSVSSMTAFMNTTFDRNANVVCVFSPPLQAADSGYVHHRDIYWTFGIDAVRPSNQRYTNDEKTIIRCLVENGLSYNGIERIIGCPKGTTSRYSRSPSQVQMIEIQSRKLQDTCSFVLRVRLPVVIG
ncbi:MAG: hypothetical protein J3Q66DRAFT_406464 [Benniella sp.]|nr:MAG: hypothetical protein J3Q66DRAFT_406464 [Benniella sp.]